jgi:hypothetical protein
MAVSVVHDVPPQRVIKHGVRVLLGGLVEDCRLDFE